MTEAYQEEVIVERDWCLRRLVEQAEGRVIDNSGDSHLVEQLDASYATDTPEGRVLICKFGTCVANCVTLNPGGIFELVDFDRPEICDGI